jgi:hypothetical protein
VIHRSYTLVDFYREKRGEGDSVQIGALELTSEMVKDSAHLHRDDVDGNNNDKKSMAYGMVVERRCVARNVAEQ